MKSCTKWHYHATLLEIIFSQENDGLTFRIEKSRHSVLPVHDMEGEVDPLPNPHPLNLLPVNQVRPEK